MLWYKSWLETRGRLLFVLVLSVVFFGPVYSPARGAPGAMHLITGSLAAFTAVLAGVLAGGGIVTEPGLRPQKGVHGSTVFTLSVPVSRLRLYSIRAIVGWLEVTGGIALICTAAWLLFPTLQRGSNAPEMLRYGLVLTLCATGIYGGSVLLATFLDDVWRVWATLAFIFALWLLPDHTPLPAFANLTGAMGDHSPPMTHATPWDTITFSVILAAVTLLAGLKVAQAREF